MDFTFKCASNQTKINNDVAYAENFNNKDLKIVDLKVVSELCMLITFLNREKRIFDAQYLLQYPVYKKLEDFEVFKKAYIENGIIVWDNGAIDIGVDAVYDNSFEYEQQLVM